MGEIDEVAQNDVDQHVKIVCVKVFGGRGIAEEKVKHFENKKLKGRLRLPVQKKNQITSKGLVSHAVGGYSFDDAICYASPSVAVTSGRCHQILFVQNQLSNSQRRNLKYLGVDQPARE